MDGKNKASCSFFKVNSAYKYVVLFKHHQHVSMLGQSPERRFMEDEDIIKERLYYLRKKGRLQEAHNLASYFIEEKMSYGDPSNQDSEHLYRVAEAVHECCSFYDVYRLLNKALKLNMQTLISLNASKPEPSDLSTTLSSGSSSNVSVDVKAVHSESKLRQASLRSSAKSQVQATLRKPARGAKEGILGLKIAKLLVERACRFAVAKNFQPASGLLLFSYYNQGELNN